MWTHIISQSSLASGEGVVADIGTGTGRGVLALANLGFTVHGIDPDARMIEQVTLGSVTVWDNQRGYRIICVTYF